MQRAINPATGELIHEFPEHDELEVDERLAKAQAAFNSWRRYDFEERARHLTAVADRLRENTDRLARLMTGEMGKTLASAESEVDKCAWVCDFYAENAERFLAAENVATDASKSFIRYEPLGAVLAIMPWNFPLWQFFRFAAPALMAGNVAVLKHAANVPGSALAIEAVFNEAGLPDGVVSTLLISSERAKLLIGHPTIRAVTLTGSDRAGREVASEAGRCLKKAVLELGGSDPFVILDDVDPAEAGRQAAKARTINSGQSCIAAKRFIVDETIADRFEEEFTRAMEGLKVGDPMDPGTDVGPMAREDLLDSLDGQVQRTVKAGAQLRTGGHRLEGKGWFYAPTVLTGVEPGMAAFDEETFGPVAAVIRAKDPAHAIELANRSQFGLGASVWTADAGRGEDVAAEIESGNVFVNGIVKSDPRLPFGGVKSSGYGRELSEVGIREFVNIKTVWIK